MHVSLKRNGVARVDADSFTQLDDGSHIAVIEEFPRAGYPVAFVGTPHRYVVECRTIPPDLDGPGAAGSVLADKLVKLEQCVVHDDCRARFGGLFQPPDNRAGVRDTAGGHRRFEADDFVELRTTDTSVRVKEHGADGDDGGVRVRAHCLDIKHQVMENQTADVNVTYQGLTTTGVFLQAYATNGSLVSGTSANYFVVGVSA